jgi:hypothetical protein
MRGLAHVDVKIIVGKNGTPCRRNPNNYFLEVHLVDDLGNDPVQQTMAATRTIVKRGCF